MAKKCPYTSPKVLKETTKGELIEMNPEKDDNIFEVDEKLALMIIYNNSKTHTKRPLRGIPVTVKEWKKKDFVVNTDTKGLAYFRPSQPGYMVVSYYDQYQRKTIPIGINVIVAPAKEKPKEKANVEAVPKEKVDVEQRIRMVRLIRKFLRWMRLLKRNSTR